MTRARAGALVCLAAALFEPPAGAVEGPATSAPRTRAVAVFPDVVPGPPPKAAFPDPKAAAHPDPSLELLSTNPYEAELAAALARQNLYGDDLKNPYSDEVHLANPYTDDLRLKNPYSEELGRRAAREPSIANPYTAALRSTPESREPAAATIGTLAVETGAGFSGAIFVDGVGVPASGAGLPVLPGSHKVTVYPSGGTPFSVSVDVPPGASQRVRLGR